MTFPVPGSDVSKLFGCNGTGGEGRNVAIQQLNSEFQATIHSQHAQYHCMC